MERDQVDRILDQWREQRPDVDVSPMGIIGRISRLAAISARLLSANFQRHGLTREAFDVLATLRRSGPPYRLNPTQLLQSLMLTSGSMTSRIDRLEAQGYVERLPDPKDRRGTLVGLTPAGLEAVDRVLPAHAEAEWAMVSALSQKEQAELARLLRKMLLPLETE
jgi:DNA-binding MarR family transcriptional regulator